MTTTTPAAGSTAASSSAIRDWVAMERMYYQHTFNRGMVLDHGEGGACGTTPARPIWTSSPASPPTCWPRASRVVQATWTRRAAHPHLQPLHQRRQVELAEPLVRRLRRHALVLLQQRRRGQRGRDQAGAQLRAAARDGAYGDHQLRPLFPRPHPGHHRPRPGRRSIRIPGSRWPTGFIQVPFNDLDAAASRRPTRTPPASARGRAGRGRHLSRHHRVLPGPARMVRRTEPRR